MKCLSKSLDFFFPTSHAGIMSMEYFCKRVVYCIWWKLGFGALYCNGRYFFLTRFVKLAAGWKQNPLNWKCSCNSSESLSQVPEPQEPVRVENMHFSCKALQSHQGAGTYRASTHSIQLPVLAWGSPLASRACVPAAPRYLGAHPELGPPSCSTTTPPAPQHCRPTRDRHQPLPSPTSLLWCSCLPQRLTAKDLRVTNKASWKLLLGWNLYSLGFNSSHDFFSNEISKS